jgi:phosphate transport system permease protein
MADRTAPGRGQIAPAPAAGPVPSLLVLEGDAGTRRRRRTDAAVRWLFMAAALSSVAVSVLIVVTLVREAATFMARVEWHRVWTDGWFPRRGMYDVKTLVVGSLMVTGVGMAVAVPVGLGTAVYLAEVASARTRRWLKPTIEMIAGVPSVVIGFFVLTFLAPEIVQRIWSAAPQQTLLAAGLGVGVLLVPLVASVADDALRAVPTSLREASYAVGATRASTVVRVVAPAAVSGLVAALILAVSRALGETMVVYIAGGRSGGSLFEASPLRPGLTMTAGMASLAAGTDNVVGSGLAFQSLFFVGLVLFVMTLGLNLVADAFVRRARLRGVY